jgi:hypothetical protein
VLVEHYRLKEMGKGSGKTLQRRETCERYLRKWTLPRWDSYPLQDVKSLAVEEWLRSMTSREEVGGHFEGELSKK